MPRATQAVALVPHPATPCAAVQSLSVQVRRAPRALSLRYLLAGEVARLLVPAGRRAARADGLWRHTCFEAFVGAPGTPGYREFNFSPSGEWAAYRFDGYREGGSPLGCAPPKIDARRSDRELAVQAEIDCTTRGPLRLGLCAVLEDAEGRLTYWALRHASVKPDFHLGESFALELDEIRH